MSVSTASSVANTMLAFLRGEVSRSKSPEISIERGDRPADCMRKLANGGMLGQAADPTRRDQLRDQMHRAVIQAWAERANADDHKAWWKVAFQIVGVLAYTKRVAIKRGWKQPDQENAHESV